ncbi:hypothetical protein J4218_04220 [Candidatus Pacearchaeota archaeon]|nr:hypothetical protein [Candidatus Pacearchaeota archaeon]
MPDKSEVLKIVDRLHQSPDIPCFEELMRSHKYDLVWAGRWFDGEVRDRTLEIKRRALSKSLNDLSQRADMHTVKFRENFPQLYDAARRLYDTGVGCDFWGKALFSAGIESPKNCREWKLKLLFQRLRELGDKPEDFVHSRVYEKDSYLTMYARKCFETFGKAVMLIGVDFLSLPKVSGPKLKLKHRFSDNDFRLILNDSSLKSEEKVRALFYGLALQYYDLGQWRSYQGKTFEASSFFHLCDRSQGYKNRVRIKLLRHQMDEDNRKVTLELDQRVQARFNGVQFRFQGTESYSDSLRLYEGIEGLLK